MKCGAVPGQIRHDAGDEFEDEAERKQGWLRRAHDAVGSGAGAAHTFLRKADVNIETKGNIGYIDELRAQRLELQPRWAPDIAPPVRRLPISMIYDGPSPRS